MRLEWLPSATADRQAIVEYIAKDSPGSAVRVSRQIRAEVSQLADSPWIGRPGRVPGTRELVVRKYPYLAVYTIHARTIHILRILHGAQHWPPA